MISLRASINLYVNNVIHNVIHRKKLASGLSQDGRTAVHLPLAYGHPEVATLLLDHGAHALTKDNWGGTPLMATVRFGYEVVAARIREQQAQQERWRSGRSDLRALWCGSVGRVVAERSGTSSADAPAAEPTGPCSF